MPAVAVVMHLVECSVVWTGNRFVIGNVNMGIFNVSHYKSQLLVPFPVLAFSTLRCSG